MDGGVTLTPPLGEEVGSAPAPQAPEAAQEAAPLTPQLSMLVPPGATVAGAALSALLKTGAAGGGLVTTSAAVAVAVAPLLPVQVRM